MNGRAAGGRLPLYWNFKRKINMEEERKIKIHGVYRHFKGKFYIVEDIAFHSETKEEYVVYRQLYGDNTLWVREKGMFLSEVDRIKYPDAKQQYRFELTDLTELNYLK